MGQVKIEALAAGQIVPAFEILDATHKKVIDGGHGVAYYWVGKNKTATLFSATPAGPFGMDHMDFLGWLYEGGGMDMYWEFYRDILKLSTAHPARDPDRVPQDLGQDRGRGIGQGSVLQEGARVAAHLCRARGAGEALHVPAVLVCGELLLPGGAQVRSG
jgi:hypothetical protein